jgi:uncharacterized membrane protein HdeD (DUF308 family)
MAVEKSPTWVRMAQIGLGIIILILSILVLINPILGSISVIIILALLLLFVGIERIVSGIVFPGRARLVSIGLGIIIVILAAVALAYPAGAGAVVVVLLGIALLIEGISRIIHGLRDPRRRGLSKYFGIGVGVLSVILAIVVIAYPNIGLALAGILIGIALLIASIQIISTGLRGRRRNNKLV